MTGPLIAVQELAQYDPMPAMADVRWYLGEPERGRREYDVGHLPGAVYVDLERHLSAARGPGRHPLPTRREFAETIGGLGFGSDDLIVGYDDRGGEVAARLWWMLRDIGHHRIRILDGGIPAWRAAGLPVSTSAPERPPARMTVRREHTLQLDREALHARLGSVTLLDARPPQRYRGDEEPIDPVAGHIPTAVSASTSGNLAEDGTLLEPDALRTRFEELGVTADRPTVVYCGSGVTACHNALAMAQAGLPEPILYPGSWSDWSASDEVVALGSEPGTI